MFFWIGRKKWRELNGQLQSLQTAADTCLTRLDEMHTLQAELQGAQWEAMRQLEGRMNAHMETIAGVQSCWQETVRTQWQQQAESLDSKAEQCELAGLQGRLDSIQSDLSRVFAQLDTLSASTALLQRAVAACRNQMTAELQNAQWESARRLENQMASHEEKMKKAQENTESRLEEIWTSIGQAIFRLETLTAATVKLQSDSQADHEKITAEIRQAGADISAQLMLLDESSRLLLLHTVMDQLN